MTLQISLTVLTRSPLLLWGTQMCNSQVDITSRFLQFRSDSDHKYLHVHMIIFQDMPSVHYHLQSGKWQITAKWEELFFLQVSEH